MKKSRKKLLYLILLLLLLAVYFLVEPYWIEEKIIYVRDNDIPKIFNQTKVVFISDIHHGPFLKIGRVRKLVKKINKLKPDIIILGGDYVHRSPDYIKPCFDELQNLKASLGIFGVLGNHDHWENAGLTKSCMKEAGIKLLDNQGIWVKKGNERKK